MTITDKQLEIFLDEMRRRIQNGNLDIVQTTKNRNSMRQHLVSVMQLEDELLTLEVIHFIKFTEDRDMPGEFLYIFKKIVNKTVFYIKLKLRGNDILVCISFHEDQ